MRYAAVALFILLSIPGEAVSADRFLVRVSVSADEALKDQAYSYLTRELRSLQDVEIVDEATARINILVVIMRSEDQTGALLGYSMAYIFESKSSIDLLPLMKENKDLPRYPKLIASMFSEKLIREGFGLHVVGGTDGLRKLCENVITKFDSDVLSPRRKEISEGRNSKKPTAPGEGK